MPTTQSNPALWAKVHLPEEALFHAQEVHRDGPYDTGDVVGVTTQTHLFSNTAGPFGGIAGQAFTNFEVTLVHLRGNRGVTLAFAASFYRPADYVGCALTEDVPEVLTASGRAYMVFVRPGERISLNPATTLESLAADVILMAEAAGMPDSYWHTSSRILRACLVLGVTPEQVLADGLDKALEG